jgi:hypothetical protein
MNADLKLYIGATEYGTLGNPISFPGVVAGVNTPYANNPVYLWNDKGGSIGSVPARSIEISVLEMWIQDEALGVSDGSPSQVFNTAFYPILETDNIDDLVVTVGTEVWDKVGSLAGQSATALIYTLNLITGLITFGDGVNGKIPTISDAIKITYMPDLLVYGQEVYDNLWLEVKSLGVTANTVSVVDERLTSVASTYITVLNTLINGVTGVWLQSDPSHLGINYYTGGSYDANLGVLTLGTPLPSAIEQVLVDYTYVPIDDLESVFTPIGLNTTHTFVNPIPKNNAKVLYFNLNVPATATPSGSNVNFRIQLTYTQ